MKNQYFGDINDYRERLHPPTQGQPADGANHGGRAKPNQPEPEADAVHDNKLTARTGFVHAGRK